MKIYFFSLSSTPWVPYSYGAIRAYCEEFEDIKLNYQWEEPIFLSGPPESFPNLLSNPRIVCFSMYLWNEQIHNTVAGLIKAKFPDALVVFGGPSIPNSNSVETRKYNADILVHGEGELPFSEILMEYLKPNPNFENIPNTTLIDDESGRFKFRNYNKNPIARLESPYLKGMFKNVLDKKIYDGIEIIALWEKERGCPYSCSFCDWAWTGSRVRYRELEKIFEEIHYFSLKKVNDIYMCDANFGLWEKDIEIARELSRVKQLTGYPQTLIYSAAKKTNERVLSISKILSDADMIWGTTLSVQSLNQQTLSAIKRINISPLRLKSFADDYTEKRVGVYSEVILGLPMETRESFIGGIGSILDAGNHEDLRMFEFFVLPNAPINTDLNIEKYGLVVKRKPLNILSHRNFSMESVDIVVETKDMPFEDWVYCYVFGELIQALHNGGYTRFFSIYLHRQYQVQYSSFYDNLLSNLLTSKGYVSNFINRIYTLIKDFGLRDDIPTVHKIYWHEDIRKQLEKYGSSRRGWFPYQYLWLMLSEDFDRTYDELVNYILVNYVNNDEAFNDLVIFQKSIMLRPNFDPNIGKLVDVNFNWVDYFFNDGTLINTSETYRFTDQATGPGHRFKLSKGISEAQFARAAVGDAYPFSKLRHFCHQPECIEVQKYNSKNQRPVNNIISPRADVITF